MKNRDEIQRAHDLLNAVLKGDVIYVTGADEYALRGALDVLCWILGHDENAAFAENLKRMTSLIQNVLLQALRDQGARAN